MLIKNLLMNFLTTCRYRPRQDQDKRSFVHFTGKIIELMESYLELEDFYDMDVKADGLDTIIDPTNKGIERSFGLTKFFERRFIQLSFVV